MTLHSAAERAVVGALLAQPDRYSDVREWLVPTDFYGVAESQTFTAIVALSERAEAVSPEHVEAEIRDAVPRGTQVADAPYLVSVMQATPDPGRAAVYGRMVLELSIRRRVAADAAGLRQRAEGAPTSTELNLVFAHVDSVRRGVETMHRRESQAAQTHSVAPAVMDALTPLSRFPRSEHGLVERDAILGMVDQPTALGKVVRWLRSGDFGDDEAGALYGELVALHDAKNPIDRITLAWRAAKVGIEGPICGVLASPHQQPPSAGEPELLARRVLEQSVQSAVIATSDELERVASDPGANATSAAYARLNALWPQQRRLIKARVTLAD